MTEVTIRPWTENDVDKICLAERVCFTDPWTERMVKDEFLKSTFSGFVLEENGVLAGYICVALLFEDAEIPKVATLPQFRRKGYGKKLVERVIADVRERGAEQIFLEVREGNVPAVTLYKDCGFETMRIRKQYYPDGENALEMKKEL